MVIISKSITLDFSRQIPWIQSLLTLLFRTKGLFEGFSNSGRQAGRPAVRPID